MKIRITKTIAASYARHLVIAVASATIAISRIKGVSIVNFTAREWSLVANSLWLSALPQIRHYIQFKQPEATPILEYVADSVAKNVAPAPVAPVVAEPSAPVAPTA